MESIYDRIKLVRKEHSLTQQAFADRLGLKQNTIATYEMGKTMPSERTIGDICREFGVDELWLRTGEGEMFRQISRDEEMAAFMGQLLADRPESFRRRLISVLLRFDPNGKEWEVLEDIYKKMSEEAQE